MEELRVVSSSPRYRVWAYLVKVHIVSEVRVTVQLGITTVDRTSARLVSTENVYQAVLDLLRAAGKGHELERLVQLSWGVYMTHVSATGRTFDLERVAIVLVESLQAVCFSHGTLSSPSPHLPLN